MAVLCGSNLKSALLFFLLLIIKLQVCSVSIPLFNSNCLCLLRCLPTTIFVSLSVTVSIPLPIAVSQPLSLYLSFCLYLCISLDVSPSLSSIYHSVSAYVHLYLSVTALALPRCLLLLTDLEFSLML